MSGIEVGFRPRAVSLAPLCAVGVGRVADALAAHVLRRRDEALRGLRAVASEDILLILGPTESLPWVDGASYLGRDDGAPLLLVPTHLCPDVAPDLFERAIVRRAGELRPPLAVLADPPAIISVCDARPLARAALQEWLGAR